MTPVPWPAELRGFPPNSLPQHLDGILAGPGVWSNIDQRGSAVCLLFIPPIAPTHVARIVLTRRSTTVKTHRGQIGLAGGRAESDDPTPGATALRELHEELGIAPAHVIIVGTLPAIKALDAHPIIPVVCCADISLSAVIPAPAEVAYVFAEPWTSFVAARSLPFQFNVFGNWRRSERFQTGDGCESIWGLTALILYKANMR